MTKIKLILFVFCFAILLCLAGCCGTIKQNQNDYKKAKIENTEIPPLMVWNESEEYDILFFLIKENGSGIKKFQVPKEKTYLQRFKNEGIYRYLVKIYKNKNSFITKSGSFKINTKNLKTYKNTQAGAHIIITDEIINKTKYYNREDNSRNFFGNENFKGEIEYGRYEGRYEDRMTLRNSNSEAEAEFSGLPALIFEYLTKEKK